MNGVIPDDSPTPLLRMEGIRKSFGPTVALDGVDLDVRAGEVVALVGENGAGKSTLMKILSGAVRPDAGRMWLHGRPYRPRNPAAGRAAGIAMIYQELSLAPHLSVMENILLGIEPTTGPFLRRRQMQDSARAALQALGRPEIPIDTPVHRLSIADRQLVEIARALAAGSRVLVFDEPTSSLTQADTDRLFDLIGRLKIDGHAIVYISHFLEEVRAISDRFGVLRDGRMVGTAATASCQTDRIVAMMVGRAVRQLYPKSHRRPGETLLQVEGLSGVAKPREASLSLRRGEVIGIAGLVGAGRTELIRAIFGLDPVRAGSLRVGVLAGPHRPHRRWRQGVGMVSEDRKEEGLALNLTLADNLTLPRLTGLGPCGLVTRRRQAHACTRWMETIPIKCRSATQPIWELSGGNQQKVALARLLHADVDVLLLDEPTRGIDVGSKAQIYRLIDQLAVGVPSEGKQPRAILMVSSYLPELFGVCDRVAVMCRGRLGATIPVDQIDQHGVMLQATVGPETEQ